MLYKEAAGLVANRLYKNVATFMGGLPEWKKAGYRLETGFALPEFEVKGIEPDQFQKLVGVACILDIRTPALYGGVNTRLKFGPNADNLTMAYKKKYLLKIPMFRLIKEFVKIPKDRMVLVIDHRGKQSVTAARFLLNNGYKEVCFLKGGIASVPD